jgi:hypothetical protein
MAIGSLINMKKCVIWVLLLGVGFSLFAQTSSNASIFIPPVTGFGGNLRDNEIIEQMLTSEIKSRNGVLGTSLQKADFILYGTIAPYHEEEQYYHDYIYLNVKDASTDVTIYTYNPMLRNSPEQVYIFQLILKNEKTNRAILLQNLLYTSIDTVYDFFPLLMFNIFSQMNVKQGYAQTYSEDWRDKWLYLRTSFDFPITFYALKDNGLKAGGVFNDTDPNNIKIQHLDNKVVALPAMTWGIEVQLLNWLSIEPNFQINWEYLNDQDFINMAAGLELKFPLKFIRNIMLEPYGAAVYPVYSTSSKVYNSYPLFAFGGGFQIATRGGQPGAVFIDINYMYYYGDTVIYNPYGKLYPKPEIIHYQRSVLGLGLGYKFGLISRK